MTNIALVVLDTLRKDAFDRHFDWLPGRRFERAFSTANWTVPAHASFFTGQYASEIGVHAKNMELDCDRPVLAERLSEAGYTTRAFSANTNITGHFGFDRGFTDFRTPDGSEHLTDEELFDWRRFSRETHTSGLQKYLEGVYECLRSDTKTIASLRMGLRFALDTQENVEYGGTLEAIDEVQSIEFGDNEFLFINVMEAHEPYRVPPEYATVEEPALTKSVGDISLEAVDGEQIQQAYDDCATYLSDCYSDLFDVLSREFDYIITLADHGEMLGEHGAWGHEHGVYKELTHVPLCVYGPEMDGTCSETVSLCDVYETVLDGAGINDSQGRGKSLLGTTDDRECITEYLGLTTWSEQKLEENGYETEREQYNTKQRGYAVDEYYGYEAIDGFEETGETGVTSPRERLASIVAELNVRAVEGNTEVPDEIKDRLKDLGYA